MAGERGYVARGGAGWRVSRNIGLRHCVDGLKPERYDDVVAVGFLFGADGDVPRRGPGPVGSGRWFSGRVSSCGMRRE